MLFFYIVPDYALRIKCSLYHFQYLTKLLPVYSTLLHFLYALLLTISSPVAVRFSLSHVLVSLFWFVLFSFTFCVFLCSLVNSSVSMFYTLVVLLFVSLMSIRLFYSFLFHYYFSVCSLCSLFLLFSLYSQFLFLYAKFNHLWYPSV